MSEDAIRAVVNEFVSSEGFTFEGIERGEGNEVYLLSTVDGAYALRSKKKPVTFDQAGVAYEVEFANVLAAAQLPVHVPRNIETKAGMLLFENDQAFFNLQTRVPGAQRFEAWYTTDTLTPDDIDQMFTALAYLHNASAQNPLANKKESPTVFDLLAKFGKRLEEVVPFAGPFGESLEQNRVLLSEKIKTVGEVLDHLNYAGLSTYPVHYDLNIKNVLWEDTRVTSVIDFDWAQESTFYFDFCRTAMLTCGNFGFGTGETTFNRERLDRALSAYAVVSRAPLGDPALFAPLLDMSTLFFVDWALKRFVRDQADEERFHTIFKAGVSRLRAQLLV